MKILKFIPVILIALFAGCSEKQQSDTQWDQLKLEDLMPQGRPQRSDKMIVGLSVFVFEIKADKFQQVHTTLQEVNNLNINLRDPQNFNANGLICGGGDFTDWQKIASSLAKAEAGMSKRTTYFTQEGATEIMEVGGISKPSDVSYQTSENASANIGLPKGSFILKLQIERLIGLRQACRLKIEPSYKTLPQKTDSKRIGGWEYPFDSASFSVSIRWGQFIFLSPAFEEKKAEQTYPPDLGERLFAVKDGKDVIRFTLIYCGLIKD